MPCTPFTVVSAEGGFRFCSRAALDLAAVVHRHRCAAALICPAITG
ncbi:hypothetical protein [Streptosporangium sp. NPDC049644]